MQGHGQFPVHELQLSYFPLFPEITSECKLIKSDIKASLLLPSLPAFPRRVNRLHTCLFITSNTFLRGIFQQTRHLYEASWFSHQVWSLLCFSRTLSALALRLAGSLVTPPLPGSVPSTPWKFGSLWPHCYSHLFSLSCFDSIDPACLQPSYHSPLIFLTKFEWLFTFLFDICGSACPLNACVLEVLNTAYLPLTLLVPQAFSVTLSPGTFRVHSSYCVILLMFHCHPLSPSRT